jgi:pimeloyl-ACP methyl ester carboxylesterase
VDSEYATTSASGSPDTAPVIYHICGEGDATEGYFLNDNAIEWAKTLGAHLVYLEHRYYGESLPFSDLDNDHMQYLTLDNVIADLAGFQNWIMSTQGWTGKWISVGGSYSGTLSAIYRQRHPELVVGALASSAPMISGQGEDTDNASSDASSTDPSNDSGDRPWVYESCTTFGFWEASGDDPSSTLYDPSASLCQELFGDITLADSAAYNLKYDAPFISSASGSPSNILFTYGSDDVWTNIGLTQQTNSNPGITLRTISGAGHHFDLNAPSFDDSSEVIAARAAFTALAKQWLGLSN